MLAGALLAAAALPRIVSINPCIDAVLVRVADPGQIAAISSYSRDPAASSIAQDVARRYRATSGTAEEVVALAPDLVIAGGHVAPSTQAALDRLHVRVVSFPVPVTIAESNAQTRAIAALAGHPERGAALAAGIEHAVAAARPRDRRAVPALIWQGGGLVPGAGTLADDLLRTAGFANLSATYGLQQWDILPLEYLVAHPPRVVFARAGRGGAKDRLLAHPALRALGSRTAVRDFPARLLYCGGPGMVEAVQRLSAARASVLPPPLPGAAGERGGSGWGVAPRTQIRVLRGTPPRPSPLSASRGGEGEE